MLRELKVETPPTDDGYVRLTSTFSHGDTTILIDARDGSSIPTKQLHEVKPPYFHVYQSAKDRKARQGIDIVARDSHWLILYEDTVKGDDVRAIALKNLLLFGKDSQ